MAPVRETVTIPTLTNHSVLMLCFAACCVALFSALTGFKMRYVLLWSGYTGQTWCKWFAGRLILNLRWSYKSLWDSSNTTLNYTLYTVVCLFWCC